MPVSAYTDTFALDTALGGQTVSPGSLTFLPTGAIFTGTQVTADGFGSLGANWFFGAASATDEAYQAFESEDASASSDVGTVCQINGCITGLQLNNVQDFFANLTAFNNSPKGFSINIGDAPTAAYNTQYLLLGGDVTGVETFVHNLGTTSGNISNATLSGTPSCVIFWTASAQTAGSIQNPVTGNGSCMVGWMCADGSQGVSGTRHTDAQAAGDTARWQHPSRCIDLRNVSANLVSATFVSMDANGYTINVTVTTGNIRVYGVAIYGGTWHAGAFTANGGGSSAVTTTGVNPDVVLVQSFANAPNTATQTNGRRGLGATDGTRQWTVAYDDIDAADPTQADSYSHTGHMLATITAGTPTLNDAFDIVSLDTEGFTYNHTTGTTGMEVIYLAGGDAVASGATPTRRRRLALLGVS